MCVRMWDMSSNHLFHNWYLCLKTSVHIVPNEFSQKTTRSQARTELSVRAFSQALSPLTTFTAVAHVCPPSIHPSKPTSTSVTLYTHNPYSASSFSLDSLPGPAFSIDALMEPCTGSLMRQ